MLSHAHLLLFCTIGKSGEEVFVPGLSSNAG